MAPVPESQSIVGKYNMSEEDLAGEAPAPLSSLSLQRSRPRDSRMQQGTRLVACVVYDVLPVPLSLCSSALQLSSSGGTITSTK